MSGKITIPIELKERHKAIVYFLGEAGAMDRKVLLELFSYALILEQKPREGVAVLYDHMFTITKADNKPPFKFNMVQKIFDQEIFALISMLGLVKRSGTDYLGRNATAFELTEHGREIHKVIASGRRAVIRPVAEHRKHIFLLGNFTDPQMKALFEKELGPACIEVGYKPMRFDDKDKPSVISRKLFQEINVCELLIVDLTHIDPAMFFQIGYAFGTGVRVVFTCRVDVKRKSEDLAEKMPLFAMDDLKVLYWGVKHDGAFAWQDAFTPEKRLRELL
jgi:hypothetical protein